VEKFAVPLTSVLVAEADHPVPLLGALRIVGVTVTPAVGLKP